MIKKIALILLLLMTDAISMIQQESALLPVWYDLNNRNSPACNKDSFRTLCNQLGTTENPKIPSATTDNTIFRIATYNVHYWEYPLHPNTYKGEAFWTILKVVEYVGADILILQEVENYTSDKGSFQEIFKAIGYTKSVCASTGWLNNYIFAKDHVNVIETSIKTYDTNPANKAEEQRSFARMKIQLPGTKTLTVYGTHLEVRNDVKNSKVIQTAGDARLGQVKELIQYAEEHDQNSNVIIGLDANTVRKKDLLDIIKGKSIWSMYTERAQQRDEEVSTKALDFLIEKNYQDSFEKGGVLPPKFTNIYGTRIDFLFLNPQWSLPISGCYTFYAPMSDHVPVIVDVKIPAGISKVKNKKIEDLWPDFIVYWFRE